jgi:hypothetical protein
MYMARLKHIFNTLLHKVDDTHCSAQQSHFLNIQVPQQKSLLRMGYPLYTDSPPDMGGHFLQTHIPHFP